MIPLISTSWQYRHKNFMVEVTHWDRGLQQTGTVRDLLTLLSPEGSNCWCIYAYIFPGHPLMGAISAGQVSPVALPLPWHCGQTYRHETFDAQGKPLCVKAGADYQHYGDELFSRLTPLDGVPSQIQQDLQDLVNALT